MRVGGHEGQSTGIPTADVHPVSPPDSVTSVTARPLDELVDVSWVPALAPVAPVIAELGDFLRAEVAAGRGYLPSGDNVLRAFRQPLDDVRVLIVGQDPYPTPGHPVGLCFSVAPDVRPLPRSLVNIYTEMRNDLGETRPDDRRPHARGPSRASCC